MSFGLRVNALAKGQEPAFYANAATRTLGLGRALNRPNSGQFDFALLVESDAAVFTVGFGEVDRGHDNVVFGHALLEKLMKPRKAITAHVWVVDEMSDESVAASLTPERLQAKPFLPLPVLGVPGWWDGNSDAGFYDDVSVFRS